MIIQIKHANVQLITFKFGLIIALLHAQRAFSIVLLQKKPRDIIAGLGISAVSLTAKLVSRIKCSCNLAEILEVQTWIGYVKLGK